jgi:uncharacterized repeat protein (TIGR03803 family)
MARAYRQLKTILSAMVLLLLLLGLSSSAARGQTVNSLYTFSITDGAYPDAPLIQATDGALYSTTSSGGATGSGTIFRITTGGAFSVVYSFSALTQGANTDGAEPVGALIQAKDGALYGTTSFGGANGNGTIFKITLAGVFTTLHSFSKSTTHTINSEGMVSDAALLQSANGDLYGAASLGGANGYGTVFKITTAGVFTLLHTFSQPMPDGSNADGIYPQASLMQAADGLLYGTAGGGGAEGYGTIYTISKDDTFSTFYSFPGLNENGVDTDGSGPGRRLIQAADGALYGTTPGGGVNDNGVVFKITTDGAYTLLYTFSATSGGVNSDGITPWAGLIQATNGALYGTASRGGANGTGVIYGMTTAGLFVPLYSFPAANNQINAGGAIPWSELMQASDGNLYGTTVQGGGFGVGTIYQVVLPPSLFKRLSFSPASVVAGAVSNGTLTFTSRLAVDTVVAITANNPCVAISSPVTIPAGSNSFTFKATTSAISSKTAVLVTAGSGLSSLSSSLTVNPITVSGLSIAPNSVNAGQSATGTVTLAERALAGGTVVSLSSPSSGATLPASVTVKANSTTATFAIATTAVSSTTAAQVTASLNGSTAKATLTVHPISLKLSPTSVIAGAGSTGTLTFGSAIPAGGATVKLASSASCASVPASVSASAGSTSCTFSIKTAAVTSSTPVTITATYGSASVSAVLTVKPITVSGLSLAPASVLAGQTSTGTVTLNAPALSGGAEVSLSSASSAATVPASVKVPAGQTSSTFTIKTSAQAAKTTVQISASLNGASAKATLTVQATGLAGLNISPSSVTGGQQSTGTLTLSSPAPAGGLTVTLTSSASSGTVSSPLKISAGKTSATFKIETSTVSSTTAVQIKATCNSTAVSATITVTP